MTLQPYTTEPIFEERMGVAYEAGREAKRNGWPLDRCPHAPGTPAYVEWVNGWSEASARKRRVA